MKLLKQTSGSFPSSYSYRVVLLLLVETVTVASDLMDTTQSHVLARELLAKFAFFFIPGQTPLTQLGVRKIII